MEYDDTNNRTSKIQLFRFSFDTVSIHVVMNSVLFQLQLCMRKIVTVQNENYININYYY